MFTFTELALGQEGAELRVIFQMVEVWRVAKGRSRIARRNGLVRGSPEWHEADAEVQSAKKAFDAAFAQAYAKYNEARYEAQNPRSSVEVERRTSLTE